jgi:hypothetical protein
MHSEHVERRSVDLLRAICERDRKGVVVRAFYASVTGAFRRGLRPCPRPLHLDPVDPCSMQVTQMADHSKTILLVDDEERDLEAICALLESTGYKVCTASSYANVLQCMEEFSYIPDLLVSDIALPDVNGK